jgi:uncharacterized metal-binding protein
MPNAKTHDLVGLGASLTSVPITHLTTDTNSAILVGVSMAFATLYLSPDLDIESKSYFRWGWLRWYWLPYQKIIKHRSVLSHSMFISGTIRFLYLFLPWLYLFPSPTWIYIWLGVCLADTVHCILDWL